MTKKEDAIVSASGSLQLSLICDINQLQDLRQISYLNLNISYPKTRLNLYYVATSVQLFLMYFTSLLWGSIQKFMSMSDTLVAVSSVPFFYSLLQFFKPILWSAQASKIDILTVAKTILNTVRPRESKRLSAPAFNCLPLFLTCLVLNFSFPFLLTGE